MPKYRYATTSDWFTSDWFPDSPPFPPSQPGEWDMCGSAAVTLDSPLETGQRIRLFWFWRCVDEHVLDFGPGAR